MAISDPLLLLIFFFHPPIDDLVWTAMSQSGVAKNIFDKFPNSLEDISLGIEQNFKPSICSVYLSFLHIRYT